MTVASPDLNTYYPPGDPFAQVAPTTLDIARQIEVPVTDPLSPQATPQQGGRQVEAPHIPGLDPPVPAPPAQVQAPADPAAATTEPEAIEPQADEDGMIRTMGQLASQYAMPEDQFIAELGVEDSEGNRTPLPEVISAWRANPEAAVVAARSDTLEGEYLAKQQELQAMHDEALLRTGNLTQVLAHELTAGSLSDVAMERLRTEDPARWNDERGRQFDMRERLNSTTETLQREAADRDRREGERLQQWGAAEARKTAQHWPEYAAPATRHAVEGEMHTYLGAYGFGKEEISGIKDHRFLRVIKDGMSGRALEKGGKAALDAAKRKGLPTPKAPPQARGEVKGRGAAATAQVEALAKRAKSTGSLEDAANLIAARERA